MSNPWKESGAMVYVALTVATFSATTMCCVWFVKRHQAQTTYQPVDEEEMELTKVESQVNKGEDIVFEQEAHSEEKEGLHIDELPKEGVHIDELPIFTLDDSDDEYVPPPSSKQQTTTV
jgi:hypothetical protein